MKKTVTLWGLDIEVTFNTNEIFMWASEEGCQEAAVTEDGRLIAFDEAINEWVQVWHDATEVLI